MTVCRGSQSQRERERERERDREWGIYKIEIENKKANKEREGERQTDSDRLTDRLTDRQSRGVHGLDRKRQRKRYICRHIK